MLAVSSQLQAVFFKNKVPIKDVIAFSIKCWLQMSIWADLDPWGLLWPRRCQWTSFLPPFSRSPTGSCRGATAAPASCRPSRSPACLRFWRKELFGWMERILAQKPGLSTGGFDWLPADTEDLVVIPLAGDFQQLLGSLQTFSYFLVVVELSRLLVVFHSWNQTHAE